MKHLRKQLLKYQADSARQAEVSAVNSYPITAARYEGRAAAFELAIALLDGALAGTPRRSPAEILQELPRCAGRRSCRPASLITPAMARHKYQDPATPTSIPKT
jgi:hypothetical protein